MKRSLYILFLMALSLMIEPLGPWQARERTRQPAQTATRQSGARQSAADSRPHRALSIPFDDGAFLAKDLRLVPIGGSTMLHGQLVNQTKRRQEKFVFAVRAYDRTGKQLKGVEEETIFGFHKLGRDKSVPLNSGYGVWLEGIPFNAVARLEIVVLDDELPTAHANKPSGIEIEE